MERLLTRLAALAAALLAAAAPLRAGGAFDGERAFALLEELCAFGPRVPGGPAHRAAGDWILERLAACGAETAEEPFLHRPSAGHPLEAAFPEGISMRNLVGRFNPADDRRVLLAAHWDSRPFCDRDPDSTKRAQPLLGANDAAGAVAALLHLAERFAAEPPPVGVDLVFFDGEDFGREGDLDEYLLGSREHARRLLWPRPSAAVVLDLVAERDLKLPIEAGSWRAAPQLVRALWGMAQELGYGDVFLPAVGAGVLDDHVPLLEAGVPAVDLIDFDFPEWHTTADTPAVCAPESLEAVGRVVEAAIRDGRLP